MSLKPMIRISIVILGVVLVVGAFVAVLTLGIGTNPPPLRIAIIQHDIIVGEHLKQGDFRIVEQIIDPRLAALYVQEHELPRYLGAYVVDPLLGGNHMLTINRSINAVPMRIGNVLNPLRRWQPQRIRLKSRRGEGGPLTLPIQQIQVTVAAAPAYGINQQEN